MVKLFSVIILNRPIAVLLNANGSFELVGFSLIPKKPTRLSVLSITDTAALIGFLGTSLLIPVGR